MTLVEPELAQAVLARALARGGDMAELYAEGRRGFAISLDDRRVERPQGGRERGACVRVVQGDSTFYGHVDGLAEQDLLRVAASTSSGGMTTSWCAPVTTAWSAAGSRASPRTASETEAATRSRSCSASPSTCP